MLTARYRYESIAFLLPSLERWNYDVRRLLKRAPNAAGAARTTPRTVPRCVWPAAFSGDALEKGTRTCHVCFMKNLQFSVLVGVAALSLGIATPLVAQRTVNPDTATPILLIPDQVFDAPAGVERAGWVVLVRGEKIVAVGPRGSVEVPSGARQISLAGTTLMPGLIEAHSHMMLHPYN